jgi:hypothetical protein
VNLVVGIVEAQAQVHILETVSKARIEATSLFEQSPAHEHASGGDRLKTVGPINGRMIGWERPVYVARQKVGADYDPRVLDCSVRVDELAADDSRSFVVVRVSKQGVEPALLASEVIVEEEQEFTLRCGSTGVACGREPLRPLVHIEPYPRMLSAHEVLSRVRRPIVDDDDLDVVPRLDDRAKAIEAAGRKSRLSVYRYDDRNPHQPLRRATFLIHSRVVQ